MNRPVLLLGIALLLLSFPFRARAATISVDNTSDTEAGSLRQAILDANSSVGVPDTIVFNIPGAGPHTIQPLSQLPAISDPLTIDGYTQGSGTPDPSDDAIPNSNPVGQGLNTTLKIEIDGTSAGSGTFGVLVENLEGECLIRGLAINRFGRIGALIVDSTSTLLEGCFIGTDVTGQTALPNGAEGVVVAGGSSNVIGGTVPQARNLISGNNLNGVLIVASGAGVTLDARVQGNLIGTDVDGMEALPNGGSGVGVVFSNRTTIGGIDPEAGNLISGNLLHGVVLDDRANENHIQGNRIGTNVDGSGLLPNVIGILVASTDTPAVNNTIGGADPGSGNLIGGNAIGIAVINTATETLIEGNFIGTDELGVADLGNTDKGIEISASQTVKTVRNNKIAFSQHGVLLGTHTLVEENEIFWNDIGINVVSGFGNRLLRNSIYGNSVLGIDLRNDDGEGAPNFPQDSGDGDLGGNDSQNFPTLLSVTASATGTLVEGVLVSSLFSNYSLEFFASLSQHPTGFGEGKTFLGSVEVFTGSGSASNFSALVNPLPPGQTFVTSTATNITVREGPFAPPPPNNTSEFSPPFIMGSTVVSVTNTLGDSSVGSLIAAILASNGTPGFQRIEFDIPPSDPNHLYYRDDAVAGVVTPASIATTTEADDANIPDLDPDWPHSWFSIRPLGPLPELVDPVLLDGYTQSGAVENNNDPSQGLSSVLRIEIDGGGLRLRAGNTTIRGLAINRVEGVQIFMEGAGNSAVEGCYLGVDVSGSVALPVGSGPDPFGAITGILIGSSDLNRIGGTLPSAANLISNNNFGISLFGFQGSDNLIQGNFIGTDRSGRQALSSLQTGVRIALHTDALIGGPEPGAGNLISGNAIGFEVVGLDAIRNVIQGNLIGVGGDGVSDVGNLTNGVRLGSDLNVVEANTIAYNESGVFIGDGTGNLITRNSIFQNDTLGIELDNLFGGNDVPPVSDPPDQDTGPNNLQNHPVLSSVTLSGSGTTVEGILQSTPNSSFRIEFFANPDRDASNFGEGQTFIGHLDIDTDAAGNAPFSASLPFLPSGQPFVTATATDTTICSPSTTPANDTSGFSPAEPLGGCSYTVTNTADLGLGTLRNALVCAGIEPGSQTIDFAIPPDDSGHLYYRDDGIAGQVTPASVATTTQADDANIADIDPDWPHSWFSIRPDSDLPSISDTVFIAGYSQPGSSRNTLPAGEGLDTVLKIEIDGTNGTGHGLDMGLNPEDFTSRHRIEGVAVNRWPGNGIVLDTWGTNTISGCFIGTDVSGTLAMGNGDNGIYLSNDPNNLIGGLDPEDRNLIAANFSDDIEIAVFSTGTKVHGNLIGTDRVGSPILPNGETGVLIHASSRNRIGGIEPGASNFIAVGSGGGVVVQSSTKRVPKENLSLKGGGGVVCMCDCECEDDGVDDGEVCDTGRCDCDCDRDTCDPNDMSDCDIGCTCENDKGIVCLGCNCNCHCDCSLAAASARNNSIGQNPIVTATPIPKSQPKGQPLPGIDLGGDGITLNDGDNPLTPEVDPDSDDGPNGLQNFPVLTSVVPGDQSITIGGFLESTPGATFRIEFYSSSQCHPSGHGPAERFLGFIMVTTDGSGLADIQEVIPEIAAPGEFITSTATWLEPNTDRGETSEFSACIQVGGETGPCPTPFPDFNNDDVADSLDLIEVIKSAANEDGARDITGDGLTNGEDFWKFSLNWQAMDCSEKR